MKGFGRYEVVEEDFVGCFCCCFGGLCFVGLMGYNLYNSAVSRISLRDKVEEVRGDENFVGFSDLPDDLVNATIAVEDHRFRKAWVD